MDPEQMASRCPGSVALGPGRLAGWRLTFTRDSPSWGGGVGHVELAPGDEVWGVLWDATDADVASLDRYEGVAAGAYVRDTVSVVRSSDGVSVDALIYIAVPRGHKAPSKKYVAALVRGAEAFGLPESYVERLRGLAAS